MKRSVGALVFASLVVAAPAVAQQSQSDSLLTVNHFLDLEQVSEAIHDALEMNPVEVRSRMAGMRRQVKEANVYRWAGNVLSELCHIGATRTVP